MLGAIFAGAVLGAAILAILKGRRDGDRKPVPVRADDGNRRIPRRR